MKNFTYIRLIFSLLGFTCLTINLHSQENRERKRIEAIVNLSKFVDWSQNKSFNQSEIKLYILADNKTGKNFEMNSSIASSNNKWKIIYLERPVKFEKGSVVFISKAKTKFVEEIVRISLTNDILTISENDHNFCQRGGMINIIDKDNQIKFEINYRNIQDKSIDISSKLLALSKIYN